MKRLIQGLMVLAVMYCTHPGFAVSPTIWGPSGLIEIPTAEALEYKNFNMAADYSYYDEVKSSQALWYKLNLATFNGLEMGIVGGTGGSVIAGNKAPEEGVFFNAKYFLMDNKSRYPLKMAVGIERLGSKENTKVYLVCSKHFPQGLKAHGGFRADFVDSDLDASILAGMEYFFNEQFSFLADMCGKKRDYRVNVGLRIDLARELILRGAFLNIANQSTPLGYTIGLSYTKSL